MRIHTNVATAVQVANLALHAAKKAGRVAGHVYFDKCTDHRSTTHTYAAEVHLVADVKEPGSKRRRPNNGVVGYDGSEVWAATWDEWGWFLAEVFRLDPQAKCAAWYPTEAAFHERTKHRFHLTDRAEV